MADEFWRENLVVQAMLAIASADERLVAAETEIIRRIYRQLTGNTISALEVVHAIDGSTGNALDIVAELEAKCDELEISTKETLLRAAYMVLMADKHIAASERKKLHDFADALEIPEIHLNAILEDLSTLSD